MSEFPHPNNGRESSDSESDHEHVAEEPIPLNMGQPNHFEELGNQYAHIYTSSESGRPRKKSTSSVLTSRSSRSRRSLRSGPSSPLEPELRRFNDAKSGEERDSESPEKFIDDEDDEEDGIDLYSPDTRDKTLGTLEAEYPDFRVQLHETEKPINWNVPKKLTHTLAYGFTTLTAQFGASALSASAPSIQANYHVGREVTTLIFSIYVIGQAVGPIIFAPLSEVAGRKIGVFIPCFISGVILCSAANTSNVWALLVYRFIAGAFSAAPIVSSGGALGDLWKAESRAAALALYAVAIGLGSTCSTIFGALLDTTGSFGWRWTFWLCGLLQMSMSAVNFIFLTESFAPVLERRKAKKLRLETDVWALHADLDAWRLTVDEFLRVHCMRPILMFITPILFVLVLYASFTYGLMFIAITSVGELFQEYHHFSPVVSYLPLLGFFFGFSSGCVINVLFSFHYINYPKHHNGEKPPPEERLWAMMCAGWLLPAGLFIYGWTMRGDIHWIVPTLGLFLMGAGVCVVFQGSLVYIVDCYTKFAASGIAANTFVRSLFGGVFPLFALQMYDTLKPGWATSILGFVAVLLWPFCFIFYVHGHRLREINPYKHLLT